MGVIKTDGTYHQGEYWFQQWIIEEEYAGYYCPLDRDLAERLLFWDFCCEDEETESGEFWMGDVLLKFTDIAAIVHEGYGLVTVHAPNLQRVFGFNEGTPAHQRFEEWYLRRVYA